MLYIFFDNPAGLLPEGHRAVLNHLRPPGSFGEEVNAGDSAPLLD